MGSGLHARWIFITAISVAVAGCVTTGGNLTSSAERLERSSSALERSTDYDRGDPGLRSDAQELAGEARDFRRAVADSGGDRRDIEVAFEDLSRSYHALRDEVEGAREREVERAFEPVTEAYLDIEREIDRDGDRSRRDRYASDDH